MIEFLLMVIGYFSLLIVMGFVAYKKTKKTPEDYFIAGRTFGPIILFFWISSSSRMNGRILCI
jgi:Na+/proline symporter